MRIVGMLFGALMLLGVGEQPACAEKRVALVIGNSAYQNVPRLDNPGNDATLLADTLRSLGFTLVGDGAQLNLDKAALDRVVQAFGAQLSGADVGLFYYAGHGVQVRGENYLIPVDANPTKEADVDFQMLDTNLVLRQMEGAGTRLNIVILDACRNNPFGGRSLAVGRARDAENNRMRAAGGGLAQMQAPEGTLISFATQPGSIAQDGAGGNSPYAKALALEMRRPGLDIFQTFNQVGLAVKRATGGLQLPWVSTSPIDGSFYFAAAPAVVGHTDTFPAAVPPQRSAVTGISGAFDPVQAGGLFTEQDLQRLKAIAIKNSLSIIPPFKIERPSDRLPIGLREFVGVWASEIAFNTGRGRHAMLIITNVESSGRGAGYYIWGPQNGADEKSPGARRFEGTIVGNSLTFKNVQDDVVVTRGGADELSIAYTFKRDGRITTVTLKPVWRLVDAERSAKR
jgi:hypothetical protein